MDDKNRPMLRIYFAASAHQKLLCFFLYFCFRLHRQKYPLNGCVSQQISDSMMAGICRMAVKVCFGFPTHAFWGGFC